MKFSFSRYSTFMECPKKYYWNYVRGLVPAEIAKPLMEGIQLHEGAAGKSRTPETTWNTIGRVAASYFAQAYPEITAVEFEVSKTIELAPDLQLECVADALSTDAVIEFKSTGRADVNTYDSLSLSIQNRLYAIVFDKPKFLLRIVKKPAIRQKKDENEAMFEIRKLQTILDAPEEHFLQIEVPVVKQGAIAELMMVTRNLNECQFRNVWPLSAPRACYGFSPCPYLKLCCDEQTYLPLFKEKVNGQA